MDSPLKARNTATIANLTNNLQVTFQVHKYTKYGQAVFVCGNLSELGTWNPTKSLKLEWTEGNIWRGVCMLPKNISRQIEFKFIISEWKIKQQSRIEWQMGLNRTIDTKIILTQSVYFTEWNKQQLTLCLCVHSNKKQNYLYYVTGSVDELGGWRQKKMMQPMHVGFKNKAISLIKGDHQNLNQLQIASFQVISFSVRRNLQKFSYYYSRWGDNAQTESFPGRTVDMASNTIDHQGRIIDIEYLGQRIIIDQSSFDDLVLQKMTNNIYLASYLKNISQFNRLKQKYNCDYPPAEQ